LWCESFNFIFLGFFWFQESSLFLDLARFKARVPGSDRVVQVNFFLKNQNDVVLVKNKNQLVTTGFLTGSCQVAGSIGSHRIFISSIFFSTRPGFSLESAGSWLDPPARILKLWKSYSYSLLIWVKVLYQIK